jgi:single-stranded DNA-specific DHH superfamily exonuclease
MFDELDDEGLLIHHWDTDGICSAAMLLKKLIGKKINTWTLPIGTFFLTQEHIQWLKSFNYVIIVDIALPEKNIKSILNDTKVMIFDHHYQSIIDGVKHLNPVAKGANAKDYPSTTWVIKDLFDEDVDFFSVLGIIGDAEYKVKNNERFWSIVKKYSYINGLSFDDLLKMVYLIDSNYKVRDKTAVEKAPFIIMEYTHPREILENKKWINNLNLLNTEIKNILNEEPKKIKGVLLKRIKTKFSLISTITRSIAWNSEMNTVVINNGYFPEYDQIYSRSSSHNMYTLINCAKKLGFNAGGKKDVLGVIIPKKKSEMFLNKIIEYLSI